MLGDGTRAALRLFEERKDIGANHEQPLKIHRYIVQVTNRTFRVERKERERCDIES